MKKQNLFFVALIYFLVFSACQKDNAEIASDKTQTDAPITLRAQSTTDLINNYSGNANYNASTKTLTFTSSGTISFPNRPNGTNTRWDVPSSVTRILINANVTVTGQFSCAAGGNLLIRGANRKTSIVFGTSQQDFGTGVGGDYITFLSTEGTQLTVENLTSLNPKGFHSRAEPLKKNSSLVLKDCRFIDNRGGFANNSDGCHNAKTVLRCYFATGDDVICNFADINQTITDCTIRLEQNTIPIQFGYNGPTSGNTTLTIKNLIITGNVGRANASFIQCRNRGTLTNTPRATKTINIDGLYFRPSVNGTAIGHIIQADDNSCAYRGTWTNANVRIANYYNNAKPTSNISICGSTSKTTKSFFCGTPPNIANALN